VTTPSRLALALALAATACGGATPSSPGSPPSTAPVDLAQPWVEAVPADVGMDQGTLAGAAAQAAAIPRFRSLLVARHGRLVMERYFGGAGRETLFDVRSVTKTVVGALTGIAIRDAVLPGLDVSIAGYLDPPYRVLDSERAITLRHLATMTSGFEWEENTGPDFDLWIESDDHVQFLLDRPQAHPPGSFFTYDTAGVHLLGVILERAASRALPSYAADRLFRPLGIEAVAWEPLDRGTVDGGTGIQLRGRDLLKLGQLYLQRGTSGGQSVVPESWVEETTRPRFTWREAVGAQSRVTYGTLWWVSDASPAAYFAWGYGGQFVYVVPARDLVVVATTDWRLLQGTAPALAAQVMTVIVTGVLPAAR
jgi:CubicO group peptidase (beta-lactamase class C family)